MRTDDELDALGVPLRITPPESWHWMPQPSLEETQGALIDDGCPIAALLTAAAPEGQPVVATEEAAPPEPARGRVSAEEAEEKGEEERGGEKKGRGQGARRGNRRKGKGE